jgi:hypothetical protein
MKLPPKSNKPNPRTIRCGCGYDQFYRTTHIDGGMVKFERVVGDTIREIVLDDGDSEFDYICNWCGRHLSEKYTIEGLED